MRKYNRRQAIFGGISTAAGLALAGPLLKDCGRGDPEPNEAYTGRRHVIVLPTEDFNVGRRTRGPALVGHSWNDDHEVIWHVYEPHPGADVEYRRFATLESRRFMLLQGVPDEAGTGFTVRAHALDAKVTPREGPGGRRYLDVEVNEATLPKRWGSMALWVREEGVLA